MLLLELKKLCDIQVLHVHGVNADTVAEELAIARPHTDHHAGIICNHLDAGTIMKAAGISQTHSQTHHLKLHAGRRFHLQAVGSVFRLCVWPCAYIGEL